MGDPMAHAPAALLEALEAVMRGASGSSRQNFAAAAAACLRVAADIFGITAVNSLTQETKERMACIRPVVAAHVAAGARGERANIPGQARRVRNDAAHHSFGAGPGLWRESRMVVKPIHKATQTETQTEIQVPQVENQDEMITRAQQLGVPQVQCVDSLVEEPGHTYAEVAAPGKFLALGHTDAVVDNNTLAQESTLYDNAAAPGGLLAPGHTQFDKNPGAVDRGKLCGTAHSALKGLLAPGHTDPAVGNQTSTQGSTVYGSTAGPEGILAPGQTGQVLAYLTEANSEAEQQPEFDKNPGAVDRCKERGAAPFAPRGLLAPGHIIQAAGNTDPEVDDNTLAQDLTLYHNAAAPGGILAPGHTEFGKNPGAVDRGKVLVTAHSALKGFLAPGHTDPAVGSQTSIVGSTVYSSTAGPEGILAPGQTGKVLAYLADANSEADQQLRGGTKTKMEAGPLSPARKKQLRHQRVTSMHEPDELLEWGENLLRQYGLWDAHRGPVPVVRRGR